MNNWRKPAPAWLKSKIVLDKQRGKYRCSRRFAVTPCRGIGRLESAWQEDSPYEML
jgi:hypothetical protein